MVGSIDVKMFFFVFIKVKKHVFNVLKNVVIVVFFVGVKTSTYKYDAFFFNKLRLAYFSICNIQYFSVFTTVSLSRNTDIDYSEGNIEWGKQTVTLWTSTEFKNMF